jgi:hypothetical protein
MHAGSCCYTWENHGGTSSRDVTFIAHSAEKSYNNPRGSFWTMLLQFVHVAIHIDSSITNITCTGYTLKTSQAFSQILMDPASESHWQWWLMLSSMLLEVFWAGRVVRADLSVYLLWKLEDIHTFSLRGGCSSAMRIPAAQLKLSDSLEQWEFDNQCTAATT